MSKKMCPNDNSRVQNWGKPQAKTTIGLVAEAKQFTPPEYKSNASGCYVEFYAFDPAKFAMRRKRIKLNHIAGAKNRKEYARGLIKRLNELLIKGWNPWICQDLSTLKTVEEAFERYNSYLEKMFATGGFRKETYVGYKSYLKIFSGYARNIKPICFVYQIDRAYCSEFLDYVFIERNNCAQTRNNYLVFLKVFSSFLLEKGYITTKPTEGIAPINKRLIGKSRSVIPRDIVAKIAEYCDKHDPHFLFACYLLYYCFIRPVEMTRLRIGDVNVRHGTVTIPAECSKNGKKQTVTMPKKVLLHAVSLGILSAPSSDYIFSEKLKPGDTPVDTKIFRDHWEKVRRALSFRKEYKFYSLKDTGITEMLENNMQAISVRDQARHSSLSITDLYTDHSEKANVDILNLNGSL